MQRANSVEKAPDWRQEEKGTTEDEMVGWHHQVDRHEFEQTQGDSEGQSSLMGCPWGCKESDMTEWLNNSATIKQLLCTHNVLGVEDRVLLLCPTTFSLNIYLCIWLRQVIVMACELLVVTWSLVPWPGIKPGLPALGVWSLSHWTAREAPSPLLRWENWGSERPNHLAKVPPPLMCGGAGTWLQSLQA